jgi:hypothetical protein
MPIDEADSSVNDSSNTATADVSASTTDNGTSTSATPDGAGVTDAPAQQHADAAPIGKPGSSKTPNATSQNTQLRQPGKAPSTPAGIQKAANPGQPGGPRPLTAEEWQKRLSTYQQESQAKINRLEAERRQEAAELQQLRQFQMQQRQQAEQAKLKPWSKQHPDHTKFQGLLSKAQVIRSQINAIDPKLPPEQQEAIKASILSAMTPEEGQQLESFQQESQQFQRDFFFDPRGTLMPLLQSEIQNAFHQYAIHQKAQTAVEQDFEKLAPVIKGHEAEVADLFQRAPYDIAAENLSLKAELSALRNRVGEVERLKTAAQEQQRLAKGNAAITRDPVPNANPDIYGLAKKEAEAKGIKTDDPRFMGILSRIEANVLKK